MIRNVTSQDSFDFFANPLSNYNSISKIPIYLYIFKGVSCLENQNVLLVNYSSPEIFYNCGGEKKLEQIYNVATEKNPNCWTFTSTKNFT